MRIYLAARYENKNYMASMAESLRKLNYEVTSRWHDSNELRQLDNVNWICKWIDYDLQDIKNCDVLLMYTVGGNGLRAGMQVEFGYALGLNKVLVIYGDVVNIFNKLAIVCKNWKFVKLELENIRKLIYENI